MSFWSRVLLNSDFLFHKHFFHEIFQKNFNNKSPKTGYRLHSKTLFLTISNFDKKRAQYSWILLYKHKSSTLVIFDNNFFLFFLKLSGNISSSCQWKIPEQQVSKLKKKAIFYQFKKMFKQKKKICIPAITITIKKLNFCHDCQEC